MPLNVQKSPEKFSGAIKPATNISIDPKTVTGTSAEASQKYVAKNELRFLNDSTTDDSDIGENDVGDDETIATSIGEEELSQNIKTLLRRYFIYMTGPDRGRKPESIAETVRDIKRVISITGTGSDFGELFKNNSKVIREKYLGEYCKKYQLKADSIRKYLYSLKDFCHFLLKSGTETWDLNLEDVKKTKNNIKMWRKNYSKKAKKEKAVTRKDDYKMLITANQVNQYIEGHNACLAKSAQKNLNDMA